MWGQCPLHHICGHPRTVHGRTHTHVEIYVCIYIYTCTHIYIYIYIWYRHVDLYMHGISKHIYIYTGEHGNLHMFFLCRRPSGLNRKLAISEPTSALPDHARAWKASVMAIKPKWTVNMPAALHGHARVTYAHAGMCYTCAWIYTHVSGCIGLQT